MDGEGAPGGEDDGAGEGALAEGEFDEGQAEVAGVHDEDGKHEAAAEGAFEAGDAHDAAGRGRQQQGEEDGGHEQAADLGHGHVAVDDAAEKEGGAEEVDGAPREGVRPQVQEAAGDDAGGHDEEDGHDGGCEESDHAFASGVSVG